MSQPLTRSILILVANRRNILAAETFLVNRDWAVFSTEDERTALTYLVEQRPSFVLISVDHPNRKVIGLHRLLKQTYPDLKVILCGEEDSLEAYQRLTMNDHQHRIHPPVTGPAIERATNRFFKEVQEKEMQEELLNRSFRRQMEREGWGDVTWTPAHRDENSLLARGAGHVVEACVNKADGTVRERLSGSTTNTACIVIESPRFSGYLIAALGGDRPFDESFIDLVRERLVRFLRDNGERVQEGESFPMKIREVRFESWALDYAEFLRKTVHEGQELALAFFPVNEVTPAIKGSTLKNMCTVRVEDLLPEVAVDFNVHLFLPANQKFLLYTPKGSVFYGYQRERLIRGGVKELHIHEDDVKAFRRYRARCRIETMISEFEERQRYLGAS